MHYIREVSVRYGRKRKSSVAVRHPDEIAKLTRKLIRENGKEHFILFCLDGNHSVIAYNIVSVGTATMTPAHPREIFQPAILAGSVSIILAHNHPSGNVEPSREDLATTKNLMEASKYLGIRILDHIIVGQGTHYSMHEHGHFSASHRNSLIG